MTRTNHVRRYSLMATASMLIALSLPVVAAANDFKVDSFIPEKFTDLEWRISGGCNLSGNDDSYDRMLDPGDSRTHYNTGSSSDAWQLDANSYTNYRFVTIPKFFELDLRVTGNFLKRSSENNSETFNTSGSIYDSNRDEYDNEQRSLSVSPVFDGGIYFDNDFFLSAVGTASLAYSDFPDYSQNGEEIHGFLQSYIDQIMTDHYSYRIDAHGDAKSHSASLAIMPGWGRIYEGMYAATALYMIDELRDKGLLLSEPSFDQMTVLTELVYQNRLSHSIDERLSDIEAIEAVSEFLVSEGIAIDSGPMRDLVLMDVYKYFPKFSREFGVRVRGGFGVLYQYQSEQETRDGRTIDYSIWTDSETGEVVSSSDPDTSISATSDYSKATATLPYLVARLEYRKPIDMRTQFDGDIEARYYTGAKSESASRYSFTTDSYLYLTDASRELDLKSCYTIQCSGVAHHILNSRTYGSLKANVGYGRFDREITDHYLRSMGFEGNLLTTSESSTYDGASFDQWSYSVDLSITYRLAIPTTLSLEAGYSAKPQVGHVLSSPYSYDDARFVSLPYNNYWRYNHYSEERYNIRAWISHYIF